MSDFKHVTASFTVSRDVWNGARTYGPVRRGSRVHYRNYRRVIPNGRTVLDIFAETAERLYAMPSAVSAIMLGPRPR